jgi:plastocyanin
MRALLTTGLVAALGVVAAAPARPNVHSARLPSATGTVEGTVRLESRNRAAPAMLSPYARRRYSPPAAAATESGGSSDVVVYLLVDGETPAPPTRVASIAQRNLAIAPHVTVVQVGTRIDFPNEDKVFHNLFSLSSTHPFNLGRYPRPQSRSEYFRKAGVVRMFCDIHSDMSAVILVVDTPYFTRADASGHFVLSGIPEGRHRLVAWHESAGADTVEVVVGASGTATASLRLPS